MQVSDMERHLARRAKVVRALESQATALVVATRALVSDGAHNPSDLEGHRAEAARLRADVLRLLDEEAAHLHLSVTSHARALVDRLHEAAIELDLAVSLGLDDPRSVDARTRARSAVARDGRAILRALLHLTAHSPPTSTEER